MDTQTHAQVKREAQQRRNAAARARRADGWGYRKVPIVVDVLETVDATGVPLVLATSDVPSEAGRYFRVVVEAGKWLCSCGAFRSLGGCHHVGHLAATRHEAPLPQRGAIVWLPGQIAALASGGGQDGVPRPASSRIAPMVMPANSRLAPRMNASMPGAPRKGRAAEARLGGAQDDQPVADHEGDGDEGEEQQRAHALDNAAAGAK
ncbi:MAG: hypothetical protein AVDCRST_MAG77-3232 [uncultured Chloroflexi bacterium]|uniref:SWIM-type domain-containing protein n=1 Tax=uncultured Chloroflexota bacterium TaxID=166587 RepID=A0A6J4JBV5_9CHLR|nr:MAG: hypothetical protein AVDCRST_MAG77-3232 [uncultured Chloroflexota bacterium]